MQTATSETEIKSRYLSICVHHYTLRAPCPKGQGIGLRPKFSFRWTCTKSGRSSHAQGKKKQWRCAFVGISTGCGRVGLLGCARPVGVASVAGAPTLCVRNICEYTSVATRPCRGARTSMRTGDVA